MIKNKVKKIIYSVLSLVLTVVIPFNVSVSAAAVTVDSLPVDQNIQVDFDANNIYLTVNGISHTINRNHLALDIVSYDSSYSYVSGYYQMQALCANGEYISVMRSNYDNNQFNSSAVRFEQDSFGHFLFASYWYSFTDNCIYVFSGFNYYSGSSNIGISVSKNYCSIRSLCENQVVYEEYNDNFGSNYVSVSKISLFDNTVTSFIREFMGYDNCKLHTYNDLPKDLICVFSNYPISGFFEPDTSHVSTPSYYFNYQYIFYKEDYGYCFIDSGSPLLNVSVYYSNESLLTFSKICNKYIYTSVDGITWKNLSNVSTMYSLTNTMSLLQFYDNGTDKNYVAKLIYTNDATYGEEPLVTPDYGTLEDITDSLRDLVIPEYGSASGAGDLDINTPADRSWYEILGFNVSNIVDHWVGTYLVQSIIDSSDEISNTDYVLLNLWQNLSSNSNNIIYDENGHPLYTQPSLYKLLNGTYWGISDLNKYIKAFRSETFNNLKSVFDNITLSNKYLDKINNSISDISYIDYSDKFDSIIGSLDSYIGKYDAIIYGLGTDGYINHSLNNVKDAINNISVGGSDGSSLIPYFVEIDSDIDYIKGVLSVNTVSDLFNDDDTKDDDLFDNVKASILTLVNGTWISGMLNVGSTIKDGASFIKSTVSTVYIKMGAIAPIFTLGASFTLVAIVIRKERVS